MSDYPMLISNKLHSFRNFFIQIYFLFWSVVFLLVLFLHEMQSMKIYETFLSNGFNCCGDFSIIVRIVRRAQ